MKIFPYKKNSIGDFYPVIDLTLKYKNIFTKTSALIDSGATISIFKAEIAQELQIPIEKGKEIYLGGVGGRIKGYVSTNFN